MKAHATPLGVQRRIGHTLAFLIAASEAILALVAQRGELGVFLIDADRASVPFAGNHCRYVLLWESLALLSGQVQIVLRLLRGGSAFVLIVLVLVALLQLLVLVESLLLCLQVLRVFQLTIKERQGTFLRGVAALLIQERTSSKEPVATLARLPSASCPPSSGTATATAPSAGASWRII